MSIENSGNRATCDGYMASDIIRVPLQDQKRPWAYFKVIDRRGLG